MMGGAPLVAGGCQMMGEQLGLALDEIGKMGFQRSCDAAVQFLPSGGQLLICRHHDFVAAPHACYTITPVALSLRDVGRLPHRQCDETDTCFATLAAFLDWVWGCRQYTMRYTEPAPDKSLT
jgi:hypothetical protein